MIDWFESIDLIETIVILHCVRFEIRIAIHAIDIDVETDINADYNLVVKWIDFVVLIYHDEFWLNRAEMQFLLDFVD